MRAFYLTDDSPQTPAFGRSMSDSCKFYLTDDSPQTPALCGLLILILPFYLTDDSPQTPALLLADAAGADST